MSWASARSTGRHVAIGGEDFTIRGGSAKHFSQRVKGGDVGGFPEELAREYLIPLVLLIEGGGGNVQRIASEGAPRSSPATTSSCPPSRAMMYVPVVGAVLGYAAGGPAGRSQLVHWSVMTKETSAVFAAGPPVVRRAMGQDLTPRELGGPQIHVRQSGIIDNEAADEEDAFEQIKAFLSYMPSNVYELPPVAEFNDAPPDPSGLGDIVPRDRRRPYSMHRVLRSTLDEGSIFEIKPHYGLSLITALARINGHPVGVIANNPLAYGGALDGDGAEKQAHFIDMCDYFHIPLVFFVDVPGFAIGPEAERAATLKRGIRAAWAGMQATVPALTIVVRKCYGMGGMVPGDSRLRYKIAWPSADWGILPIEGGVEAAYRREIEASPDPAARRQELEDEFAQMSNIFRTAEAFGVEEIIDPRETRTHPRALRRDGLPRPPRTNSPTDPSPAPACVRRQGIEGDPPGAANGARNPSGIGGVKPWRTPGRGSPCLCAVGGARSRSCSRPALRCRFWLADSLHWSHGRPAITGYADTHGHAHAYRLALADRDAVADVHRLAFTHRHADAHRLADTHAHRLANTDRDAHVWGSPRLRPPRSRLGGGPRWSARAITHTCAVRESGEVVCWGYNDYGQSDAPPGEFRSVSAGVHHSCALRESGEIACWGSGQLTAGSSRRRAVSAPWTRVATTAAP